MRAILIVAFCLSVVISKQTPPSLSAQELRVGAAFTEEQGKQHLEESAKSIQSCDDWKAKSKIIRDHIKQTLHLEQLPEPCELDPRITATHVFDGYSVDNIAIQTLPGFWLTGNLYRPNVPSQTMPGILSPHGHWPNGRMHEQKQSLCAALARAGAIVFAYDMVGFGESKSFDHKHPLVLQLQTYNSIRALDYLCSREDVDQTRLACTGASGGGTQTFVLAAIDDRLDVSAPICMVSSYFYGGCVCESGMPIHVGPDHETNNVEIAATFAPKPLLLVSNGGDWTKHTPDVEYPFIKRIYELCDAPDTVENAHFPDEEHDYGPSKQKAAILFLSKHLGLKPTLTDDGKPDLSSVTLQPESDLKVFSNDADRPANSVDNLDAVILMLNRR